MEVRYIIAIATVSLFGLLFLIGICIYLYNRAKQRTLWNSITAMYNNGNHTRIDYDYGFENETNQMVSTSRAEGQLTIEDIMFDGAVSSADEGIEEITGNYNPD